MVTIVSTQEFLAGVREARDIVFGTYVLGPRGKICHALEEACERGAHVVVRLEEHPYRNATGKKENDAALRQLRAAGADVREVHGAHLKAAVIDGKGFLDDCNWNQGGQDTIVRETARGDVRRIQDAIRGKIDPPSPSFATSKDDALAQESRLLHSARSGEDIVVATESFGRGTVYKELMRLALHRRHVRLVVSARPFFKENDTSEVRSVRALEDAGVDVRVSGATQKFAVAGQRAWLGSANATREDRAIDRGKARIDVKRDWGIRTKNPAIIDHLRAVYNDTWRHAVPFAIFSKVLSILHDDHGR